MKLVRKIPKVLITLSMLGLALVVFILFILIAFYDNVVIEETFAFDLLIYSISCMLLAGLSGLIIHFRSFWAEIKSFINS